MPRPGLHVFGMTQGTLIGGNMSVHRENTEKEEKKGFT